MNKYLDFCMFAGVRGQNLQEADRAFEAAHSLLSKVSIGRPGHPAWQTLLHLAPLSACSSLHQNVRLQQSLQQWLQKDAGSMPPLTEGALSDAMEAIRRSFPRELAASLPQGHPLLFVIKGTQPACEACVSTLSVA